MVIFWEPPLLLSCWVVHGTYLFHLMFSTILVHSLPGWHVFMSSSLVRAAALVNSSVKCEENNESYSRTVQLRFMHYMNYELPSSTFMVLPTCLSFVNTSRLFRGIRPLLCRGKVKSEMQPKRSLSITSSHTLCLLCTEVEHGHAAKQIYLCDSDLRY